MTHPNEELVRRAFDAFASGGVETLRELMNQDSVCHAPGRNPLAGDHRGVDAILSCFARATEFTEGTFRLGLAALAESGPGEVRDRRGPGAPTDLGWATRAVR
jgi:ketosteroid isomerase-like protein